jgi:hypothetical protein
MKKFAAMFVGGALGLVLLKLVFGLVLPFFAMLAGLVALAFKLVLFAVIGYFVYRFFVGRKRESTETV